jgi:predicted aspartyl protease
MRVGPASQALAPSGPYDIVVRGRARYGQLVLIDSTAEGVEIDVIIDSGLQTSIGNEPLRRLLITRRHQFEPIQFVGITGETFQADYTVVDNMRIGGIAIRGMPVAFADTYFFRRMRMNRRPALLLGMDALEMFRRVTVDFRNRRAHFLVPEGTPIVDPPS